MNDFPTPDTASARHSERVVAHLRQLINEHDGAISFARFMHEALYAPGLGYYAAGNTKFGEAGDFTTAPELSPLFGAVVARQVAEVLRQVPKGHVVELGAGSGALARDILTKLEALQALPDRYQILEVSPDLAARQQQLLQQAVPHLMSRVEWLQAIPISFDGVIVANEVLDALPVERFVKRNSELMQLRVTSDDQRFRWTETPAPDNLRRAVARIENDLGYALPNDYRSDVSLAVPQWIHDLAVGLRRGAVFLLDYGVSRREYYAADRTTGWLRCHFRHHAHSDPFVHAGIQDITAWVDFSLVASAAVASDLDILGYVTQAQFLLAGGLQAEMEAMDALPTNEQLKVNAVIKTLTLPGEMGENFKCIGLSAGDIAVPSAFLAADRTRTL